MLFNSDKSWFILYFYLINLLFKTYINYNFTYKLNYVFSYILKYCDGIKIVQLNSSVEKLSAGDIASCQQHNRLSRSGYSLHLWVCPDVFLTLYLTFIDMMSQGKYLILFHSQWNTYENGLDLSSSALWLQEEVILHDPLKNSVILSSHLLSNVTP